MILVDDVSYSYGASRFALRDVSLRLSPGEMLAVLGANGSGKSTLARLMNGLLLPAGGSVLVDEFDTRRAEDSLSIRSRVGMVFQHPDDQIVATSVEDDVAFGPENLGLPRETIRQRVDDAIRAVGLSGLERREPHLLSGGQKQRLAIAGALAMQPEYLVLDEPTAMIDSQGRRDVAGVLRAVRASGRGVMLITHDIAEAAMADRVVILCDGRLEFGGALSAILRDADRLDRWGLELPDIGRLAEQLRSAGAPLPPVALDAETIVEALWP